MKLVIFDLDDTLFDTSGQLDETFKNIDNIKPFPETKKILSAKGYTKVLVTRMKHGLDIQNKKIDVLGIRKFFDEILFCPKDEEKKSCFEQILKRYPLSKKEEIYVIGNKRSSELRAGKMLGLKTILLKHGKYKDLKPKDSFEEPDYTIKKLDELLEIIQCKP